MSDMTLDEFVRRAKAVRREADDAEHRFMKFLCWAEEQDFWKGAGLEFTQILSRYDICRPERFLGYKRTWKTVGPEKVREVGVHGATAAGKLREPRAVREFISEVKSWEDTNKTSISEQSANRLLRDTKLRSAPQSSTKHHKTRETLVGENERLREQVERLKQENAALKKENRDLKKQLREEAA